VIEKSQTSIKLNFKFMITNFYKSLSVLLILIFVLTGCGGIHGITRAGYNFNSYTKSGCTVSFARELKSDLKLESKGSISLTDKGSTKCSPKDAFDILRNEACELDANLVIVSNERMPDIGSSCYRCDATFYNVDSNFLATNYKVSDLISNEAIETLTSKSNTSSTILYIVGFAVGFAGGWLIMQALKK